MAQNTSEATYTGYARIAVARSAVGWTVTGASGVNAAVVQFGENTGVAQNVTHFGIGFAETGAGRLLFSKAFAATKEVRVGDAPKFAAGALEVTVTGQGVAALNEDLLKHILQNADIANIGDAAGLRGSTVAGSMWISLHTANPQA